MSQNEVFTALERRFVAIMMLRLLLLEPDLTPRIVVRIIPQNESAKARIIRQASHPDDSRAAPAA